MKKKQTMQDFMEDSQSGFTLIEVTLVLAITGLMLIGLIGGSFASIARQRYNDTLRDFSEYMSGTYNTVIRPESLGDTGSTALISLGNSKEQAILGKVLVFGANYDGYNEDDRRSVFSATLVGSTEILRSSTNPFIQELAFESAPLNLVCGSSEGGEVQQVSSVSEYTPLWDAFLQPTNANNNDELFRGTMIIARTPTSATVHTAFVPDLTYDLKNRCTPENQSASEAFVTDLVESANGRLAENYSTSENTVICVKSTDVGAWRAVQIDSNGNNSSAVKILSESDSNSGEIRCR